MRRKGFRVATVNEALQNFGHNPDLETTTKSRLNANHIDARALIVYVTTGDILRPSASGAS